MALGHFSYRIPKKAALPAFALLVIGLTTTSTYAGFQWVPAPQEEQSSSSYTSPADDVSPPPYPLAVESAPLSPMPGLNVDDMTPPQTEPAPAMRDDRAAAPSQPEQRAPRMQTRRVSPPPSPERAEAMPSGDNSYAAVRQRQMGNAPSRPMYQNYTDYSDGPMMPPPVSMQEETNIDQRANIQSENNTETLKIPPRLPPSEHIIVTDDAPTSHAEVEIDHYRAAAPPPPPAAEPVHVETKVIVPDDAPSSAMAKDDKMERLNISSYPDDNQLAGTQDEPLFQPQPQGTAEPYVTERETQRETQGGYEPSQSASSSDFAVVEGFGSDVPLALALRQVAPPSYAFSFGNGINPGYRVSWSGGRPWNEIVGDMVAPLGYGVRITKKTVLIYTPGQASAPQDNPSSAPEPAPSNTDSYFNMQALEPAAGDAGADISEESENSHAVSEGAPQELSTERVSRPRAVKRINVRDPGGEEQNTQPETALQKMAAMANQAVDSLIPSANSKDTPEQRFWESRADESLRDTLDRWSREENVQLVWDVSYDYPISSDNQIQGSFEHAVEALINEVSQSQGQTLAVKYLDGQQRQLLVQDQG